MRIVLCGLGLVGLGLLQMPSTPPMKVGLWETTNNTTISMPGMATPPGMEHPQAIKWRRCVTADSWAKSFTDSNRTQGCTKTNQQYGGGHFSVDLSCPSINGTGHVEMTFTGAGAETGHGTVHMALSSNGHPMVFDSVIDAHFVSADCGAVAPGKTVMVR